MNYLFEDVIDNTDNDCIKRIIKEDIEELKYENENNEYILMLLYSSKYNAKILTTY